MREHDYVFFTSYNGQYFQKQQNQTTNEIIFFSWFGEQSSSDLWHL